MSDSETHKVLEDYFNSLLDEDAALAEQESQSEDQQLVEQKVAHAGERKHAATPVVETAKQAKQHQSNRKSSSNNNFPDNVTDLRDHVSQSAKDIVNERSELSQEKTVQKVIPVESEVKQTSESKAEAKGDQPLKEEPVQSSLDQNAAQDDIEKHTAILEEKTSEKISEKATPEITTPQITTPEISAPKVVQKPAIEKAKYEAPVLPKAPPEIAPPQPKAQIKTHEEKLYEEQKTLEAEKREQLQRMLNAQLPKQQTETKRELTAQEKLEILAEQQKAALFRAKLNTEEAAQATKKIVEETLRAPVETPSVDAPSIPPKITPTEAPPETEVEAPVVAEDESLTDDHVKITEELLAWGDSGRPHWADQPFEVLLFDVSGLSLAVPLVTLGQIVPMSDKLTKLQGQSDWFMGILPSPVGDIRTINTAMFVMPERYDPELVDSFKYVVTIDGLPWGLAVDQVNQPITLNPDDVKWRGERTKRPWLAGTVKSHMCALLDIPQMAHILENMNRT